MPRTTPIDKLRKIGLALPGATEKEAWGTPTFRVQGRMFAMFASNHHNDDRIAVWCKAPLGFQSMMIAEAPTRFFIPPYVGVNGWVGMRLDVGVDWKEVAHVVGQAYQMAAEKPRARTTRPKNAKAARR
jgi:hypothetical protein